MVSALFSANSHFIEPPDVFEGRMPAKWRDRAPRVVDFREGKAWVYEDQVRPLLLCTAVAGVPPEKWTGTGIARYENMRPGVYDPKARLHDMDEDGIAAAVIYSSPSGAGFAGDLFFWTKDVDLGHEAMRAYNDWIYEEWTAPDRDRLVAIGCISYADPQVAAEEVRRNALRGFRGALFREPADYGQPWTGTGHWDPFFEACEETGTVVVHHTNSNQKWPHRPEPWMFKSEGARVPYGMSTTLFQSGAMETVVSWVWAGLGVRFPKLKINIAESGGSWLPHLIRRMDWALEWSPLHREGWPDMKCSPVDFLRSNFYFSTLEVDVAVEMEQRYGLGGWMIEDDYPHMESVWPKTPAYFAEATAGLDAQAVEKLRWRNASELFSFPMPAAPAGA